MNNRIVTTGLLPMTVGSMKSFQLDAKLDGLPWDLTGATATVRLNDPNDNLSVVTATVEPPCKAIADWEVPNVPGTWSLAWDVTDSTGRREISLPFLFTVVNSPDP